MPEAEEVFNHNARPKGEICPCCGRIITGGEDRMDFMDDSSITVEDDDTFDSKLTITLGGGDAVTEVKMDLVTERRLMHRLIERAKARGDHLTV
jgi:hypothetical protein